MALSETFNENAICNMALGRIGSKRLTDVETDTSVEAIHCRLHYEQTRNELQSAHLWRFCTKRLMLWSVWADATDYTTDMYVRYDSVNYKCSVAHTSDEDGGDGTGGYPDTNTTDWTAYTTEPEFEYTYVFSLPSDFLRLRSIYDSSPRRQYYKYAIENNKIYTDNTEIYMRYLYKETTVSNFDELFTKVLVLELAKKLNMALTQDSKVTDSIENELKFLMKSVRAIDRNEQEKLGRYELNLWNDERLR